MGFPRLTVEEQTELAPQLMNCLEGKPQPHQDKYVSGLFGAFDEGEFKSDFLQDLDASSSASG